MHSFVDAFIVLGRGIAALVGGWLPRRRWDAWPGLSIRRLAGVSGLLTLAGGVFAGTGGFLHYAWRAAGGLAEATWRVAERQARGPQSPADITTQPMQAFSALSIVAFMFFTPLGWVALYLSVTGVVRAVAAFADDPVGDPILTGLDHLVTRSAANARQTRLRRAREREEGAEVPDRLFAATEAGVAGFDYLVVSSRRKADWNAGTFVITGDKWYTLGEAFDARLPEGLRTVYPLREQKVAEVLRRGVAYDLPPLERGRLPFAPPGVPVARGSR